MKKVQLINLLVILISLNCSGLKEVHNTDIEIKIVEINSWLNLMPGGPGSFHLSGEFAVYSDTDNMIMEVDLKEVSVFSKEDLLYRFKPVFNYSRTEPDYSPDPKKIDLYQFFTESGLEIREVLMGENLINIELTFNVDDDEITMTVNDIELTRAY